MKRRECFVAQCFDGGHYDRRYKETFAPAIQEGGATPVRADEVLGTNPIIEKIESSLKKSTIAFAEVSEDNPNVFLEVGYALALGIPTVIVCDRNRRNSLPFDIRHRPIIFYSTEAQSDFEKLAHNICENVRAALAEAAQHTDVTVTSDLSYANQVDTVKRRCLLELLDQDMRSPDGTSLWELQKAVVGHEISETMVALAIANLIHEGLAAREDKSDYNGNEYRRLVLTESGQKMIMREYSALMKEESDRLESISQGGWNVSTDSEVPF